MSELPLPLNAPVIDLSALHSPVDRALSPAEGEALTRLISIAKRDTGQSRRVADFLLAWWNAGSCGAFDLTTIWGVDSEIAADMVTIFGAIAPQAKPTVRTLHSGRQVPELTDTMALTLTTHCPAKWLSLDMETGEVWVGCSTGWRRATAAERQEAVLCIETPVAA